jgi:hypothetical protein
VVPSRRSVAGSGTGVRSEEVTFTLTVTEPELSLVRLP